MASNPPELRWRNADESDDIHLCSEDEKELIIYGRQYTVGQDYRYSETNGLIKNFEIGPKPDNRSRLVYRDQAILRYCAEASTLLSGMDGRVFSLVPIPTSFPREHPDHDDRLHRVALCIATQFANIHYLPLLDARAPRMSLKNGGRRDVPSNEQHFVIDDRFTAQKSSGSLLIIDDVITSGSSFLAARNVLQRHVGADFDIFGLFWAKAVRASVIDDDLDR